MKKGEFNKFLEGRYKGQVNWYDQKAISNKKWNNILQILVIIIAATLPVSAVLEFKWPTIALSIIVAIGTGILKFCKFEEHWHNYRTTCETLKKEKSYYDAKIGEYKAHAEPEELFVERVESLISQAHTKWDTAIKKSKNSR